MVCDDEKTLPSSLALHYNKISELVQLSLSLSLSFNLTHASCLLNSLLIWWHMNYPLLCLSIQYVSAGVWAPLEASYQPMTDVPFGGFLCNKIKPLYGDFKWKFTEIKFAVLPQSRSRPGWACTELLWNLPFLQTVDNSNSPKDIHIDVWTCMNVWNNADFLRTTFIHFYNLSLVVKWKHVRSDSHRSTTC